MQIPYNTLAVLV